MSSQPRELYRIENLHPPGHPVTAAILTATLKETDVRTRQVDSGSDTNNNNKKLQWGCHPVAVVILHVYKLQYF